MNTNLAAAGLLLVFLAVAVGSGAFASGDELTRSDADGSVYFAPGEGPSGAYAEYEDGRINLVIDRLNPSAETYIDGVFEVGYEGEGTAEAWVKHGSERVTFYDEDGEPVENDTASERLVLSTGESAPVGVRMDSGRSAEILSRITLVALLPSADDLSVSTPGRGGSGADIDDDVVETPTPSTEDGGTRSRLEVDLGEINVRFRQPEFGFETGVSREEVGVGPTTDVAAVVGSDEPGAGESVVVTGVVRNTGDAPGSAVADLRVNGRVIETRNVELGSGEETTVEFNVAFGERGRYEVAVGDSEPVTVTVGGFSAASVLPYALVAALVSLVAVLLILRRRKEDADA